jgi:hypothetical protein
LHIYLSGKRLCSARKGILVSGITDALKLLHLHISLQINSCRQQRTFQADVVVETHMLTTTVRSKEGRDGPVTPCAALPEYPFVFLT